MRLALASHALLKLPYILCTDCSSVTGSETHRVPRVTRRPTGVPRRGAGASHDPFLPSVVTLPTRNRRLSSIAAVPDSSPEAEVSGRVSPGAYCVWFDK